MLLGSSQLLGKGRSEKLEISLQKNDDNRLFVEMKHELLFCAYLGVKGESNDCLEVPMLVVRAEEGC